MPLDEKFLNNVINYVSQPYNNYPRNTIVYYKGSYYKNKYYFSVEPTRIIEPGTNNQYWKLVKF